MRRSDIKDELKDLGFDFLFFYARFEFALKENGYLKKTKPGAPAEAAWKAFREKWEGEYVRTSAATALIEANPKKQEVGDDGSLQFRTIEFSEEASDLEKVVAFCQVVRNNLFHGGKSHAAGWDDPERTKMLLSTVVQVLGELAHSGEIDASYTGYY